jgi:hypothetical protein
LRRARRAAAVDDSGNNLVAASRSALHRLALLAVTLALPVLQGCAGKPTAESLSDEDYVRNFETVAFYREFDPDGVQQRLMRWDGPLRVALVGDVNERYRDYAAQHLADLAALSGLEIGLADLTDANVVVILSPDPFERALDTYRDVYMPFFGSREAMEETTAHMKEVATCYARYDTDLSGEVITRAMALIPTDEGRFVVRACLIEELTQIMGLFNDSDDIVPSIFNDSSPNMVLSEHDRILMRVLYDPRLEPGMTWSQAELIVRQAVADLRN